MKRNVEAPSAHTGIPVLQRLNASLADSWQSIASLQLPPETLARVRGDYLDEATRLWNELLQPVEAAPPRIPDRRFAAPEWSQYPASAYTAQMYLLNARTLMQLADSIEGDAKTRARLRFAVQQWVDAAAPSNYFALNPEAQRNAIESGGQSLFAGLNLLLQDLRQGRLSQTDEHVFEVGRNLATSAGAVVFENEIFQLLEYQPLTAKVHARPLLMVPPCINKYYILDLQPDNSLIRYTVEQGHRVFVVSWRNPDAGMADYTWDRYIEDAAIRAIEVVQEISRSTEINTLGFCVGGTILATALAVLTARGRRPSASMTLLTSFLDFSETGVLDIFIDETSVRTRELTLGPDAPGGAQLLRGRELATTFSFLRPTELVWNYVVSNYLKGEAPPAFDLLYWNSDSTNLPGPMYCWYLRNTYLENNLVVPGKATVCGEPVDFGAIGGPSYIYASREDHIVPWRGAYVSTQVLGGEKRFVLGASGHIAGVINPPAKGKRSHWTAPDGEFPTSADGWFDSATEHGGSWWPDWARWLEGHAGKKIAAPKTLGSRDHPPIEPAPGRYVKQKA